jgi:hypothetical protein
MLQQVAVEFAEGAVEDDGAAVHHCHLPHVVVP